MRIELGSLAVAGTGAVLGAALRCATGLLPWPGVPP
jgi:hypothetical protein